MSANFDNGTPVALPIHPAERVVFQATLRPHRTLSKTGARWLYATYFAAFGVTALPFLAVGFWPISLYLILTALLLSAALKRNFYDARAYEAVRLTYLDLNLQRVSPRGKIKSYDFSPHFVRLHKKEHPEFGIERLAFAFRTREVEVAKFLGADDKARFAKDVTLALHEARRGPDFTLI